MSLSRGTGLICFVATIDPFIRENGQMLHNASTDPKQITGDLHDSIRTGNVRKKAGGGKKITIGVHYKDKGAYYANPVEFGHGGPAPAPAHPFVRPAFDTRSDEAYEEIKRVLRDELSNL